jgi:hypothetical protein
MTNSNLLLRPCTFFKKGAQKLKEKQMPEIDQKIIQNIDKAIKIFLAKDIILLENDSSERSITHKLACYLERYFPEWDVDCEYNRNLIDTKKLKDTCKNSSDENGSPVFPDIIIHKRITEENYIVIEVKKTTNPESSECDIQKLKAFINELGYQYGLFIRFKVDPANSGVEECIWINKTK